MREQILAEVEEHGGHRPQLGDGGERGARVVPAQEGGNDPQVTGARDRQEFGDPLHDPEDDGLEDRHDRRRLVTERVSFPGMRLLAPIVVALTFLILAAPALAGDNGEGLVGETDDRIVTFFCLGLVIFFTLVAILGSALQGRLERRKQERKAVELRKRVGW